MAGAQEFEAALSRDRATALKPGNRARPFSPCSRKKKKIAGPPDWVMECGVFPWLFVCSMGAGTK